jgi:cellulose synthase/poly-beta-1,6-N-acetylglucosamine synthase-like glycosyltransferase
VTDVIGILTAVLAWSTAGCVAFLLLSFVVFGTWTILGVIERGARVRSGRVDDLSLLETSRFTIPVSVVVPAYNEAAVIVASVQSLLAQRYPTLEVIVVNDGSTDATLEKLQQEFGLQRCAIVQRSLLPSREPRAIYRSTVDPRLLVIDKTNGGKAEALNCGVNRARYRYVCCVDGDSTFEPDAILKAMRPVMRDPRRVIAVTSHFSPSSHPETAIPGGGRSAGDVPRHWLVDFQHLEYLRSFLNTRLAWSRGNYMLITSGGFMVYRRDVVEELGGFSSSFTCEDIELSFRAHERYRREGRDYRILSLPDTVGHTEVPLQIRHLISQRARWQRVTMETTWHYRRMLLNPRYGLVGLVGAPYYAIYESLSPLVECLALTSVLVSMVVGTFHWQQAVWLAAVMALAHAIFTNIGILLHDDGFRRFPTRYQVRLMLLAPLDLILYRPFILYARCRGIFEFLRGDKSWERFQRNARPKPA